MRIHRKVIVSLMLLLMFIPTAFGQARVSEMKIKQRFLKNGLRVVSLQDNSSPSVAIHVFYKVGGKDDPKGRSGFAHMFEHMMFKSTKNMPNEKLDRLTEDVGGFNNATTSEDFTSYFEVVPSNHLERLLWAEAERMQNLNVDEANFSSERDVVKEEYRQRILAQPYGRLYASIDGFSFQTHPYQRGVIGNLDELAAASTSDARAFFKTFYRPDNAVLIVVGDFDQKQFDAWTDKYFSSIARPAGGVPRVGTAEPEWTAERRYLKTAPIVPFPATVITYLAPPSTSEDVPALQIAASILSNGESSRLYLELVRNQQIAQDASFNADIRVDKGLLYFFGIASEGHTSDELERAFLTELVKIQDSGVTAKELEKAKNQLITQTLSGRENNDGKAFAIERAIVYQGTPWAVNSDIADLQGVTKEDVQRVMKKYFAAGNRVVIHYQQAEEAKGKEK